MRAISIRVADGFVRRSWEKSVNMDGISGERRPIFKVTLDIRPKVVAGITKDTRRATQGVSQRQGHA